MEAVAFFIVIIPFAIVWALIDAFLGLHELYELPERTLNEVQSVPEKGGSD